MIIRGGNVVLKDTVEKKDILVENGKIVKIADYIQANFGDEDDAKADFVNVVEDVDVDTDDPIVGDDRNTADYSVPVEPITIKSVKITKY